MGVSNRVEEVEYEYGFKTDHSMFCMNISTQENARGPGYWKFNKLMLHDIEFVNQTNEIIENAKTRFPDTTPEKRWQCCKSDLIKYAKKFSVKRAKQKKEKYLALLRKVDEYNQKVQQNPTVFVQEQLKFYEKQIEDYLEMQVRSSAFRARAKYLRDFEKNTKFFFSLEKANHAKKKMNRVINENGKVITDDQGILEEQRKIL